MTKVLSKQIKVSVGFDNFEMGFEKQEIGGLEPHVCHQLLTNQRLVMMNPFYPMFFLDIIQIMIPMMIQVHTNEMHLNPENKGFPTMYHTFG